MAEENVGVEREGTNYRGNGETLRGLKFERRYTKDRVDPLSVLEYETRIVRVPKRDNPNEYAFQADDIEVPNFWSQNATDILASKYLRKKGIPVIERENSAKQAISRISETIRHSGEQRGYFATPEDAQIFQDELTYLMINQKMAFNSPVWFNQGLHHMYGVSGAPNGNWAFNFETGQVEETKDGLSRPQCSACFIQRVGDSLKSMLDLQKSEVMLFKQGSGTGSNLSPIRGKDEPLSGGGVSSGVIPFMSAFDRWAGVIKSGGTTRRAAKMAILDYDHPDILEFIDLKKNGELLIEAFETLGYGTDFEGMAYSLIPGQNANNSVRVSNSFMKGVLEDQVYSTIRRTDGSPHAELRNRDVFRRIAIAAHKCGDPGLQFDDTINSWHTVPNTDRIHASNPCSEFMFLDDTSCNLASLNLLRFLNEYGTFDIEGYKHAVDVTITAQEIIVDQASYPTRSIAQQTHDFRPLGLGYANLGALLMHVALPYDSDAARALAAGLTAVMTGEAYVQSSRIASQTGAFEGFEFNKEPFMKVMKQHRNAAYRIAPSGSLDELLLEEARNVWDEVVKMGEQYGYRNAQTTVLAPTGTISFVMDCDTTGGEPDLAIVKQKKLVGGGRMTIVNQSVAPSLKRLGYGTDQINEMVEYAIQENTLDGAPHIREEHLAVFDTALKPEGTNRVISPMGHIKMMEVIQPFFSGAISKTVNLPEETTVEEIENIYMEAWKRGLKSVALYREGSKKSQPLNVSGKEKQGGLESAAQDDLLVPTRIKLPGERASITHKFDIAGHEGYITMGTYDNGKLGEVFISMSKEGGFVGGIMDSFATTVSLALQYGVPLRTLTSKYKNQRFEPNGLVRAGHPEIHTAKSIVDYIGQYLEERFDDGGVIKGWHLVENDSVITKPHSNEEKENNTTQPVIDVESNKAPKKVKDELGGFCPLCATQLVKKGNCMELCPNTKCNYKNLNGCGE